MNMRTHFGTIERAIDYAVTRDLNPEHWRIVETPEGVRLVRQQEDRRAETPSEYPLDSQVDTHFP
jgi:hypothetical protein